MASDEHLAHSPDRQAREQDIRPDQEGSSFSFQQVLELKSSQPPSVNEMLAEAPGFGVALEKWRGQLGKLPGIEESQVVEGGNKALSCLDDHHQRSRGLGVSAAWM
jgi:hypothetical protein